MAAANSPSVSAPFWCSATSASSSDAMPARSIGSCSAGASTTTPSTGSAVSNLRPTWVAEYPSKRCDVKGVDNVLASEACKATCGTCGDSDVVAFWYKPHYQCGASAGSTPDAAAAFINAQGKPATLQPYTCCNDTDYDGGLNRYASDRVMVAGGLVIDALEGGSVAPGGPLPDDLSYTCHAAEEHAPIRAHISTK